MKNGIIVVTLGSWLLIACSEPSKQDICGPCSGDAKTNCEAVYEACNDDGDCLESLEDTKPCG